MDLEFIMGIFQTTGWYISWSLKRDKHPVQGQSARVYCPVQTGDREIKLYLIVIVYILVVESENKK